MSILSASSSWKVYQMPYEMSWYVENRAIETRLYGDVTEEEIRHSAESLDELLREGQAPLFLLIDLREVTRFPSNFSQMLEGISAYRSDNSVAWTITIFQNSLYNLFAVLASKTTGIPMQSFRTLEQADEFIAHIAPELASFLPSRETA
jgi:hypothetical protein